VQTIDLGQSGLRVSRVGVGCNNFGRRIGFEETEAVVEAALDAGVTFFDTAASYGEDGASERFLGQLFERRRGAVVIATKFGWSGEGGDGTRDNVRRSLAESLERLRTDVIDLYYLHRPDPETPIGDTLKALDELVLDGSVRAIGCSNFSAEQLVEADRTARELGTARFTVLQNHYSVLERRDEDEVLPLCRELEIAYVPYFPLASGLLTGKYRRGEPAPEGTRLHGREIEDERLARVERLTAWAEERGHTILELAISALASTPGIASIIAGATRPEQVRANAAATGWALDEDELAEIALL
jgi:aryl-alcohol dehydrogenase-like predicted oxidoreductase